MRDRKQGSVRAITTRGRAQVVVGRQRVDALVDQHADRPVLDVPLRLYRRDREMVGPVVSSALAFRLFLFFVPLLLFGVGLAGFSSSLFDADDVNEQAGITGSLAQQIDTALSQTNQTRWVAVLVGLVGIASTGRTLSKVMVSASCLAWGMPVRSKASARVVGVIVGLVVGTGLLAVIVNRIRADLGIGVAGLSFLAVFCVYLVLWLAVSALLPRASSDLGALLPGAALVALSLAAMQALSQLYLPSRFDRASELYGSIGAAVVTLGWFFILARAIVLAMALDAVIHEGYGRVTQFVFSLPVLRLLARWSRVRRLFDLDREVEEMPSGPTDVAPEVEARRP
jgi:uncharacterized BrkB/YihY/UPF0761 family membrane protein